MSERVTVELPEDLAKRVRVLAAQSRRPLEEVLVEYIGRAVNDPPVDSLPDDQVLQLCDSMLGKDQQEELSDLLARNREGLLDTVARQRLEELMHAYRRNWVRKAEALRTAVARGLKPRLS